MTKEVDGGSAEDANNFKTSLPCTFSSIWKDNLPPRF